MPTDYSDWPWYGIAIFIVVLNIILLFKEPLKGAMPTFVTGWFETRKQRQLERRLKIIQKQESQEDVSKHLIEFITDELSRKLDVIVRAQTEAKVEFAELKGFIQGVRNERENDKSGSDAADTR